MESVLDKLHKKRLKEKNIVIEDMFSRHGEILVRSTDGQRNDNVVNCPRIEKRYFHNNKFIYAEKNFDKNTNYTFFFGHDSDSLSCPNCGYEGKVKDFNKGCPFCKTNFNINYTAYTQGSMSISQILKQKEIKILCAIFTLLFWAISVTTSIFDITFTLFQIIWPIITLPFAFIFGYLLSSLCIIPLIIYRLIKLHSYNKVWDKLHRLNINASATNLINNLVTELLDYYYDEEKAPKCKDLIDFDIIKYNNFHCYQNSQDKQVYMIVDYTIRKIYFYNNKIHKTISKNKIKLKHNNDISIILKNGYKVMQCENCGASVEITADECEYCRTPIKFKNEWTIEEFINLLG